MADTIRDQFPRTTALPVQSPLYWVEQKDRYLRQLLIRDIEELTQRRLLVYFANRVENALIEARDALFISEVWSDIGRTPSTCCWRRVVASPTQRKRSFHRSKLSRKTSASSSPTPPRVTGPSCASRRKPSSWGRRLSWDRLSHSSTTSPVRSLRSRR